MECGIVVHVLEWPYNAHMVLSVMEFLFLACTTNTTIKNSETRILKVHRSPILELKISGRGNRLPICERIATDGSCSVSLAIHAGEMSTKRDVNYGYGVNFATHKVVF